MRGLESSRQESSGEQGRDMRRPVKRWPAPQACQAEGRLLCATFWRQSCSAGSQEIIS